ncbi:MAG: type II secretion system F family protein [Fimbriimonadaceae bacterium]
MPLYSYSAQTPTGSFEQGVLESGSLDLAAQALTSRGLQVTSLQETADAPPGKPEPPAVQYEPLPARSRFVTDFWGRIVDVVPLRDLQFFFRQFGVMLDAGINPADAFNTLAKGAKDAKLRSILHEGYEATTQGQPLSTVFVRYPEVFTPLMHAMVRVGEDSGTLPEQCRNLSEYIERDIHLRNTIKRETAGPKITVFASIGIILLTNVLITSINTSAQTLPVPIGLWLFTIAVAAGVFFYARVVLPRPEARLGFDRFVLRLPGIGRMVHGFAMAKFGRAFGAMYKAGVPVSRAVEIAADACGNSAVREAVRPVSRALEGGTGLTEALASTGAFSPLVLDMTRTGEETGETDQMLLKVADFYEEEGALSAQIAAKVIGVACLLAVAAYVLFVVVSFYTGYFSRLFA